jgi:hypothetical protein
MFGVEALTIEEPEVVIDGGENNNYRIVAEYSDGTARCIIPELSEALAKVINLHLYYHVSLDKSMSIPELVALIEKRVENPFEATEGELQEALAHIY